MTQSLTIGMSEIRQLDGLYSLNDLHKAAGGEDRHQPAKFTRLDTTQELAKEIQSPEMVTAIESINGGQKRGTYVCRELVYAYAMWISPKFHLTVIRAFDAQTNGNALTAATNAERIALAHRLAAQAVAKVSESVFEAVLANPCDFWKHDRYLLSFDYNPSNLPVFTPKVSVVDKHAFVMTLERLARAISDPDHLADDAELIRLAAACCQRIAQRIPQRRGTSPARDRK